MVVETEENNNYDLDDAEDISEETELYSAKEVSKVDINENGVNRKEDEKDEKENKNWVLWKHIHFYSLPDWMKDNEFLHHGHRPELPSFAACFQSIFKIHSETGNIWTHLLGSLFFLLFAVYFFTRPQHEMQWEDKFVFAPFFFGTIACMGISFIFHTIYCHSEEVCKLFNKLDYWGISIMTIGTFLPWYYYVFYCYTKAKLIYMSSILVVCSVCMYFSFHDYFMTLAFRPYRVGIFVSIGAAAVAPAFHCIAIDGFWTMYYELSLDWILLMAVVYLSGALIYAYRVPERYFPGKCDIWWQSHQIFHVSIIIAAYIHYHAIRQLAERRIGKLCEDDHNKHDCY